MNCGGRKSKVAWHDQLLNSLYPHLYFESAFNLSKDRYAISRKTQCTNDPGMVYISCVGGSETKVKGTVEQCKNSNI